MQEESNAIACPTRDPARHHCEEARGHKGICTVLLFLTSKSGHCHRERKPHGGNQVRCLRAQASTTGSGSAEKVVLALFFTILLSY